MFPSIAFTDEDTEQNGVLGNLHGNFWTGVTRFTGLDLKSEVIVVG
jgi:hypothetical protein